MADWIEQHLDATLDSANQRGQHTLQHGPLAVAAGYHSGKIAVELDSGVEIRFLPAMVQGLQNATPAQLAEIRIEQNGLGLYWPQFDVDLYVPAMLQGWLGSKRWMAERGKKGGQATTPAKAAAARANGQRGGRPRRAMATEPHEQAIVDVGANLFARRGE